MAKAAAKKKPAKVAGKKPAAGAVMSCAEVMKELKRMGNEQTVKIWKNHGAKEPMFGVKIGDMKTIVKKVKNNHQLALELFDTGNVDAQYLAGLISEPEKMTDEDLNHWAETANWQMITDYAVAWTAAESGRGFEIGRKWIDSPKPTVQCAGWSTLSGVMALTPDEDLKIKEIEKLLHRVAKEIHKMPDRVRYTMNGFIISVGGYVAPLTQLAKSTAEKIGKVEVDMGDTDCKVPDAKSYIEKMESMGRVGRKRKTVKC